MMSFLRLVDADSETARGLIEAVGQLDGDQAIKAMADYGRHCGFDVTPRDIEAAAREPLPARGCGPESGLAADAGPASAPR